MATIRYTDGTTRTADTLDAAEDLLRAEGLYVERFPDRSLAWRSAAESADDDGTRAVAEAWEA